MQHHWYDCGLQRRRALNRQIDRSRCLRLDPIAEAAQCAVGCNSPADAGGQRVEGGVTVGALDHSLDLGAVLVVIAERRQRDLGFSRFAVTQDQQAIGGHTLGKDLAAQSRGGQCRELRVQRGEDDFARAGHDRMLTIGFITGISVNLEALEVKRLLQALAGIVWVPLWILLSVPIVLVFSLWALGIYVIPMMLLTVSIYFSAYFFIIENADLFQRMGSANVAAAIALIPTADAASKRVKACLSRLDESVAEPGDYILNKAVILPAIIPFSVSKEIYVRFEIVIAILGTLQWGFGDLVVHWLAEK